MARPKYVHARFIPLSPKAAPEAAAAAAAAAAAQDARPGSYASVTMPRAAPLFPNNMVSPYGGSSQVPLQPQQAQPRQQPRISYATVASNLEPKQATPASNPPKAPLVPLGRIGRHQPATLAGPTGSPKPVATSTVRSEVTDTTVTPASQAQTAYPSFARAEAYIMTNTAASDQNKVGGMAIEQNDEVKAKSPEEQQRRREQPKAQQLPTDGQRGETEGTEDPYNAQFRDFYQNWFYHASRQNWTPQFAFIEHFIRAAETEPDRLMKATREVLSDYDRDFINDQFSRWNTLGPDGSQLYRIAQDAGLINIFGEPSVFGRFDSYGNLIPPPPARVPAFYDQFLCNPERHRHMLSWDYEPTNVPFCPREVAEDYTIKFPYARQAYDATSLLHELEQELGIVPPERPFIRPTGPHLWIRYMRAKAEAYRIMKLHMDDVLSNPNRGMIPESAAYAQWRRHAADVQNNSNRGTPDRRPDVQHRPKDTSPALAQSVPDREDEPMVGSPKFRRLCHDDTESDSESSGKKSVWGPIGRPGPIKAKARIEAEEQAKKEAEMTHELAAQFEAKIRLEAEAAKDVKGKGKAVYKNADKAAAAAAAASAASSSKPTLASSSKAALGSVSKTPTLGKAVYKNADMAPLTTHTAPLTTDTRLRSSADKEDPFAAPAPSSLNFKGKASENIEDFYAAKKDSKKGQGQGRASKSAAADASTATHVQKRKGKSKGKNKGMKLNVSYTTGIEDLDLDLGDERE